MFKQLLLPSAALLCWSTLWLAAAVAQDANEQVVKAAHDAFYAALSARSSSRIEHAWAHYAKVTNIFAVNPTPTALEAPREDGDECNRNEGAEVLLRALEDGVQPPVASEPGERPLNHRVDRV